MKKILTVFLTVLLTFSCTYSFASEVTSGDDNSGDNNTVYLNDYSEYQDIIQDMDGQAEYKELFNQMVTDTIEAYKEAERNKVYRAKVLEASEVLTEYGQYPSYYEESYYKVSYQNLKIKILDEPYKDKEVEDVMYLLTCDTYENIKMPSVKEGTIINVNISEQDGEVYPSSASYDVAVQRWPAALILILITVALIIIYTNKHSAKVLVPIILLFDLVMLVVTPLLVQGTSVVWIVSLVLLLSTITICALKLGVNEKAVSAFLSTAIILIFMTFIVNIFDFVSYMCGITYEATYIMEYIMPKFVDGEIVSTLNFHALSIGITVLMCIFATIGIVCKTVEVYNENKKSKEAFKLVSQKMAEYTSEHILLIVSVLLIPFIYKYSLLLINKCSFVEIINSEVLITEISRILFIIISILVAVPITYIVSKFISNDD